MSTSDQILAIDNSIKRGNNSIKLISDFLQSVKVNERNLHGDDPVFLHLRDLCVTICSHVNVHAGGLNQIEGQIIDIIFSLIDRPNMAYRLPNLIMPGFGKCGTTSAHRTLLHSDDIDGGCRKETRYFNAMSTFSSRLYAAFFPDSQKQYLLDSSPAYMVMDDHSLEAMRNIAGDTTFIIFTREPGKRAVSAYDSPGRAPVREQARTQQRGPELPTLEKSLHREMDILERLLPRYYEGRLNYDALLKELPTTHIFFALYDLHLNRFRTFFPEAKFIVCKAEDTIFKNNYQIVTDFLGIESISIEAKKENVSTDKSIASKQLSERLTEFFFTY